MFDKTMQHSLVNTTMLPITVMQNWINLADDRNVLNIFHQCKLRLSTDKSEQCDNNYKVESNMHRCDIKSGSFIFTIIPKVGGPLISSANLKSATLRTSIFLKIFGPSTNMEISRFAILQTIYLIYGPHTAQLFRVFGDWMRGKSVYSHRVHIGVEEK
jgi:hypothetical protein